MFKYFFIIYFLSGLFTASSQVQELDPTEEIKSITFKSNTNQSELPILGLNDRLTLEFDVLNPNEDDFYYVIEHYNFDWTKSKLMKSEYLQGLDNLRIINYENSFNTYQIYSNYKLQIPNKQTRLRVSGNYLIKIFDEDDELVFSRKFMIYENLATVGVQIKRSRDVSNISTKQSVDFVIKTATSSLRFNNPKQTVNTVIIQNNNLKTAISGLKPQYILGNELIYRYKNDATFWGGNEYLNFDSKFIRNKSVNIVRIERDDIFHHYIYPYTYNPFLKYRYYPDINGQFVIRTLEGSDSNTET